MSIHNIYVYIVAHVKCVGAVVHSSFYFTLSMYDLDIYFFLVGICDRRSKDVGISERSPCL